MRGSIRSPVPVEPARTRRTDNLPSEMASTLHYLYESPTCQLTGPPRYWTIRSWCFFRKPSFCCSCHQHDRCLFWRLIFSAYRLAFLLLQSQTWIPISIELRSKFKTQLFSESNELRSSGDSEVIFLRSSPRKFYVAFCKKEVPPTLNTQSFFFVRVCFSTVPLLLLPSFSQSVIDPQPGASIAAMSPHSEVLLVQTASRIQLLIFESSTDSGKQPPWGSSLKVIALHSWALPIQRSGQTLKS